MTPAPADAPTVALRGITKRFGDVVAVQDVTLDIRRGQIHALLGENGAGKTSLMNVLAGLYRADAGTVLLDGRPAAIHSPEDAKRLGVGMVHQEQRLVTRLTAPENIALGHWEPRWLVTPGYFRRLAERVSERYGLAVEARHPVWTMALGRRQRVELVKLLHHGARVIVLDEPTATLAPAEVETFFSAVRRLAAAGRTVILITHKLDDVMRYTDHVTIMRGGRVVAAFPTSSTTRERLNQLMVGATEPGRSADARAASAGETVLDLSSVSVRDPGQRVNLHDISLQVRAGEIVAVAGVAGNGQTELAEAVTGHAQHYAGAIRIGGREIRGLGARRVSALGVAYVPEDRREVGLIAGQSVAINLALRRYHQPPRSHHGWVDYAAIRREAAAALAHYGIRPADPDVPVGRLSGGNQQRVIVAREFAGSPRLIVADNFTRGLDPRSSQQFVDELFAHRDRGAAVIWITGDLAEALLCDRVAVMNRGRLVGVLGRAEATRERVGLLMSGDVAPGGAVGVPT